MLLEASHPTYGSEQPTNFGATIAQIIAAAGGQVIVDTALSVDQPRLPFVSVGALFPQSDRILGPDQLPSHADVIGQETIADLVTVLTLFSSSELDPQFLQESITRQFEGFTATEQAAIVAFLKRLSGVIMTMTIKITTAEESSLSDELVIN